MDGIDHKKGKLVTQILALQKPDGTWGPRFHALSVPTQIELMTTEQALRRLKILGFTIEDEPIRRAVGCMRACLRGERDIDNYWEKGHNWALFTRLMLSAWVLEFSREAEALECAESWARVIEGTFRSGMYDDAAYRKAYSLEFGSTAQGGLERDIVDFYHVSLLRGQLSEETESSFLDYILAKPDGIYYIYDKRILDLPRAFATRETVRYLAAVELLLRYEQAPEKMTFVKYWLEANRGPDGQWDLGPKARDGIYLPLGDHWHRKGSRPDDCTEWISRIYERFLVRT